jgi:hypothetical protein
MKLWLSIAVTALITAAVLAPSAWADKPTKEPSAKPVKTRLTLVPLGFIDPTTGHWEYDFGGVIGDLLTHGPKAACAQGREVSVFRNEPNGLDTLIGSRKTDAVLHVAIVKMRSPDPATVAGAYYAKTPAATKRNGKKKLKCQAAKSDVVNVVAPDFATPPR